MADVTKFQKLAKHFPVVEGGVLYPIKHAINVVSGDAGNGDVIIMLNVGANVRIYDVDLDVSATLGALCTVLARHSDGTTDTNLTAASTAGGASYVSMNRAPLDADAGDTIELVVGGAAIAATATITLDVQCVRR